MFLTFSRGLDTTGVWLKLKAYCYVHRPLRTVFVQISSALALQVSEDNRCGTSVYLMFWTYKNHCVIIDFRRWYLLLNYTNWQILDDHPVGGDLNVLTVSLHRACSWYICWWGSNSRDLGNVEYLSSILLRVRHCRGMIALFRVQSMGQIDLFE